MGLDDLLISTGVDQLIRLMRERGRVEIGQAARELSVQPRTVEDWAHVLEEEGLIAVEYKLTKVFLVWKAPTAEYVAKKSEQLQERAGQTRAQIEKLLSRVEEGGKGLAGMEEEISRARSAVSMGPQEVEALKQELAALNESQGKAAKDAGARLEKLRKKVGSFGAKSGLSAEKANGKGGLERELEVLHKFEETLQSELSGAEEFFGAFEARSEAMRRRTVEGGSQLDLDEIRKKLQEVSGLKSELAGAVEAVADQQKAIDGMVQELEGKVSQLEEDYGGSPDAVKKRIAEIEAMRADAARQKAAIEGQLQEALLSVKKHSAKIGEMAEKEGKGRDAFDALRNEYVDISEELAGANDELLSKQKEISEKVAVQMAALDVVRGGSAGVSREELDKVSFLLRELEKEQSSLEESVRGLLKQFDVIRLEAAPVAAVQGAPGAQLSGAAMQAAQAPAAFVEKVRLSEEEEGEFERKREELRSLIRKMWEEGKGGHGS